MTVQIQTVTQATDSFGQWLSKTNQLILAVNAYAVTVNSNTAAGNAAITGKMTANLFVSSNSGSFNVGTALSNSVSNATSFKIQSPVSNIIITTTGTLIAGVTQYSGTIMSLGNTVIRGSNVSSNNLYLTTYANVGNTFLTRTSAYADSMNTRIFYVSGNATFGDNQANTYIDRFGIGIYSQPTGTYIVNTNFTATTTTTVEAYANNFHGNLVPDPPGSATIFRGNTHFLGTNNYFDYGLTSNGNIDIYGPGLHYLHSWNYKTTPYTTANAVFLYQSSGGGIALARNLYQTAAAQYIITQGVGEILNINRNSLAFYTYYNGTAGSSIYTQNLPFYVNNSLFSAVTSANVNFGNTSINPATNFYGPSTFIKQGSGANRIAYYGGSSADLAYTADADQEAGQTNYTLRMDGGQFQFAFSTSATAYDFGTSKAYIDYNGNLYVAGGIGINKTPGSAGTLAMTGDINNDGNINSRGNITAFYTSDRTLKTNVTNISNALEKVNQINGVEFDWTDEYITKHGGVDGYFNRKHDVGVIAQEIEAVLPEVVATKDDGTKAVRYEKIVALLIEAVKELSAEVEELKKRV
jgi:hypothetical protein